MEHVSVDICCPPVSGQPSGRVAQRVADVATVSSLTQGLGVRSTRTPHSLSERSPLSDVNGQAVDVHRKRSRRCSDPLQAHLEEEEDDGDDAGVALGSVAQLQDFVCSQSNLPQQKVLAWSFEQHLDPSMQVLYRGTVSFSVDTSEPLHFCGGWQVSKRVAQRDTAERVLWYYQRRGQLVWAPQQDFGGTCGAAQGQSVNDHTADSVASLFDLLAERKGRLLIEDKDFLWNVEELHDLDRNGKIFRATLSVLLDDKTPRHFCGGWHSEVAAARDDTADRVLWFIEHSASGLGHNDDSDKTVLMYVQNQLQKLFGKKLPQGQSVWMWSYESSEADMQVFRAVAHLPILDKRFVGAWCRGKKAAQRSACAKVREFLDSE
mmetsp:Transcript_51733/g.113438  ORF Transcript_51733/g.113438 Transcript_51733/m.113438 type:complete len:377 (+) Transcript_51733:36-1166(+)|eukprot:CAMPEP_0204269228 /NCGR_PEP_ID=MMETSP0468-20130131/15654_1 /ASSEMBLY_ACC=CAM_ASM_000383 /TAXON_ID=2969 /ORGANISM="Oxyrrhis marina" /LENGTH=376 /DNA_ID=CAMNT_0051244589 /DNA_START=35 /DNA_END=1165 /DNA_ORIENTATION=-